MILMFDLFSNTTYTIAVVGINCFGETEPASVTNKTLEDGIVDTVVIYCFLSLLCYEGLPQDPWFEVLGKEAGNIIVTYGMSHMLV